MLIRSIHAMEDLPSIHALVQSHPLGVLTTGIASPPGDYPFLQSSHIPWVLDVDPNNPDDLGTLRGHIARQNPQAKAMIESLEEGEQELKDEVLVLFTAPAQSYVTPKYYTFTKPSTGKVVPTYDYSAVQVYGRLTLHHADTPSTSSFLHSQMSALSQQEEERAGFPGDSAWKITDAPEGYIKQLKRAVVGLEIRIERAEGKVKAQQEMRAEDREGVVKGFRGLGTELGKEMSEVTEREGRRVEEAKKAKKAAAA
ncbi:hypothetical protein JCM6882_001291 [Rhodosporidiobolus microsporus]